jgi:hypothetical protein
MTPEMGQLLSMCLMKYCILGRDLGRGILRARKTFRPVALFRVGFPARRFKFCSAFRVGTRHIVHGTLTYVDVLGTLSSAGRPAAK